MYRRVLATPAAVKEYVNLFVNRLAYTVQSMRPDPQSGRHYYYRPKERGSGAPLHLTEKTVADHLQTRVGQAADILAVQVTIHPTDSAAGGLLYHLNRAVWVRRGLLEDHVELHD